MLEIRPNCEWCDRDLPPQSGEARICTYECTVNHRDGKALGLVNHPASTRRVHSQWTLDQVRDQSERLKNVPPDQR